MTESLNKTRQNVLVINFTYSDDHALAVMEEIDWNQQLPLLVEYTRRRLAYYKEGNAFVEDLVMNAIERREIKRREGLAPKYDPRAGRRIEIHLIGIVNGMIINHIRSHSISRVTRTDDLARIEPKTFDPFVQDSNPSEARPIEDTVEGKRILESTRKTLLNRGDTIALSLLVYFLTTREGGETSKIPDWADPNIIKGMRRLKDVLRQALANQEKEDG